MDTLSQSLFSRTRSSIDKNIGTGPGKFFCPFQQMFHFRRSGKNIRKPSFSIKTALSRRQADTPFLFFNFPYFLNDKDVIGMMIHLQRDAFNQNSAASQNCNSFFLLFPDKTGKDFIPVLFMFPFQNLLGRRIKIHRLMVPGKNYDAFPHRIDNGIEPFHLKIRQSAHPFNPQGFIECPFHGNTARPDIGVVSMQFLRFFTA